MSNRVWFMGGMMYEAEIDTHRAFAVRPTQSGTAYTADTLHEAERLWGLCRHHSHLYSLTNGEDIAILTRTSSEASSSIEPRAMIQGDAIDRIRKMKWGQ